MQVQIELSFMEAVKGVTKTLRYRVSKDCGTCDGDGAKPGSKPRKCSMCRGTGETVQSGMGFFQVLWLPLQGGDTVCIARVKREDWQTTSQYFWVP